MKTKSKLLSSIGASVFCVAAIAHAGLDSVTGSGAPRTLPGNSHAFNTTPAQLAGAIVRGMLLGDEQSIEYVGPFKRVNAQSYQTIGGSGTMADPTVEVGEGLHTVKPGTPLCRFLFYMYRETYQDGSIDPQIPDSVVLNQCFVEVEVTLDGKVLLSNANKEYFYIPETALDPMVVYPAPSSYGSLNAFAFQGIFFDLPPLPRGNHTLKTHLRFVLPPEVAPIVPPEGIGLISDATVTIVVTPD